MNIRKRVAYNFRRLRKTKGWTPTQAAEAAGKETNIVYQIENKHVGFGVEQQQTWTKVFSECFLLSKKYNLTK